MARGAQLDAAFSRTTMSATLSKHSKRRLVDMLQVPSMFYSMLYLMHPCLPIGRPDPARV